MDNVIKFPEREKNLSVMEYGYRMGDFAVVEWIKRNSSTPSASQLLGYLADFTTEDIGMRGTLDLNTGYLSGAYDSLDRHRMMSEFVFKHDKMKAEPELSVVESEPETLYMDSNGTHTKHYSLVDLMAYIYTTEPTKEINDEAMAAYEELDLNGVDHYFKPDGSDMYVESRALNPVQAQKFIDKFNLEDLSNVESLKNGSVSLLGLSQEEQFKLFPEFEQKHKEAISDGLLPLNDLTANSGLDTEVERQLMFHLMEPKRTSELIYIDDTYAVVYADIETYLNTVYDVLSPSANNKIAIELCEYLGVDRKKYFGEF